MNYTAVISSIRFVLLACCVLYLLTDAWGYSTQSSQTSELFIPIEQILPQPSIRPQFSRNPKLTHIEAIDSNGIARAQQSFLGKTIPVSIDSVSIYRLTYEIQGKDDTWSPIQATVYIPNGSGPYPLFIFGSGTTGIADKCAPSLEDMTIENIGNYRNHMITQAVAGYTAVFPDYEGYGDPSMTEAYFIADSESKVLLGAIQQIYELSPSSTPLQTTDTHSVFVGGYSQGGHASLASAQSWEQLPPDIRLRGVIQYAGAGDVHALFLESPWLASYLVESFSAWYGQSLDPHAVLQPRWVESMTQNNAEHCVNSAYRFYPHSPSSIYGPVFLDAIESNTWPSALQPWKEAIEANTPFSNLPDVPYLSIQGATDPIVTAKAQRENIKKLCRERKNIVYTEYPGVNHFQIRRAGFEQSTAWMRSVLAGEVIETSCL